MLGSWDGVALSTLYFCSCCEFLGLHVLQVLKTRRCFDFQTGTRLALETFTLEHVNTIF